MRVHGLVLMAVVVVATARPKAGQSHVLTLSDLGAVPQILERWRRDGRVRNPASQNQL